MSFDWHALLEALRRGQTLERRQMSDAVNAIMEGGASPEAVREFLVRLHDRGETADEIAGAVDSMRRHMIPVPTSRRPLVDTCGTGGDRSSTFNISTAAAIVVSACGVAVAKHGNRSVTSRTGSADVLETLGIAVDCDPAHVARCIDEVGIGFCYAPRLHPAMREVASIRRGINHPTIFNLIGPLANPAGAPFQLIGVGRPGAIDTLADAVALVGTTRTLLVRGEDGLDELTTAAPTRVVPIDETGRGESLTWNPGDFGLETQPWTEARVDSAEQSAAMIRSVLDGMPGVARDLVLLNAAATLALVAPQLPLRDQAQRAAEAIDSGAAKQRLQDWIEVSRA